jgi:Fn3 associated
MFPEDQVPRHSKSFIRMAAVLFILSFIISCSQRYPFFIQIPEFVVTETEEGTPGIMLNIVCEDENAVIRYTTDGSQPSEVHGLIYEEPLYLAANAVYIQAVAVRVGYPAGPLAEYYYEPQD